LIAVAAAFAAFAGRKLTISVNLYAYTGHFMVFLPGGCLFSRFE
jgi:hypothetical protein